jgi:starch phosphorylase
MAKLIIRLLHGVAEVVNADPAFDRRLKVVFLSNVKTAQPIYQAADLSEQISTAGKKASGTGNMKFMMNGALTIGTLDGANVDMREEVGADNFFLFGLSAEQVGQLQRASYRSAEFAERDAELRESLELIASGHFSRGDREMFRPRDRRVLQAHLASRPGCGGARALSLRCAALALSLPCAGWRC